MLLWTHRWKAFIGGLYFTGGLLLGIFFVCFFLFLISGTQSCRRSTVYAQAGKVTGQWTLFMYLSVRQGQILHVQTSAAICSLALLWQNAVTRDAESNKIRWFKNLQEKRLKLNPTRLFIIYSLIFLLQHLPHAVSKLAWLWWCPLQCNLSNLMPYQITNPEEINGIICVKALM